MVNKLAEEYAEEQNSAYTNDYYGFIAGFNKAKEILTKANINATTEQIAYKWLQDKGVNRKHCKLIAELITKFNNENT